MKNGTEVTFKLSVNVVDDSNGENDFPHKLLLTNSKLRKAFGSNYSANIKLSKTQFHEVGQSRGFLGRTLGSLLRTGFPLMQKVLQLLTIKVSKYFNYQLKLCSRRVGDSRW